MTFIFHRLPRLPQTLHKLEGAPPKPKAGRGKAITHPDELAAQVKWLCEHGFSSAFIADFYTVSTTWVGQLRDGRLRAAVKPWPPSWINEAEFLRQQPLRNKDRP